MRETIIAIQDRCST